MDGLFVQSTREVAVALIRAIRHGKIPGSVNTTVCELWVRQLYSTEVGVWTSKVDSDMIARLNPMTASSRLELIKVAES